MRCTNCGGELPKLPKNRRRAPIISELCVKCQLTKLGWKTDEQKAHSTEQGLA